MISLAVITGTLSINIALNGVRTLSKYADGPLHTHCTKKLIDQTTTYRLFGKLLNHEKYVVRSYRANGYIDVYDYTIIHKENNLVLPDSIIYKSSLIETIKNDTGYIPSDAVEMYNVPETDEWIEEVPRNTTITKKKDRLSQGTEFAMLFGAIVLIVGYL